MKRLIPILLMFAFVLPLCAQQPSPPKDDDPFGRYLYPPELIMGHQEELGLQERQRAIIKTEVQKAQSKFFDLQWQMSEEGEKMVALLRATPVDEAKVLEQADKIMGLEREIKRTHLTLLIRLRNMLTPEQTAMMNQIKKKS